MRLLCIYHGGNCADGFAAAWAVRRRYPDAEFFAGVYQTPPPDVSGRDVLIVDFSYKRPVLLDMAKAARRIVILDHHKSAVDDLVDLPENVHAIFDMNRSGAMITWNYLFPDSTPPKQFEHIQDRDLWRFELPLTREILAAVFSYPYDFETWDTLMSTDPSILATEGTAINRKHMKDIRELLAATQRRMVIGGIDVPVANLPYIYSSDAGHIMAQNEHFAACYWDTPDGRVFSLRSTDAGMDVCEIAKQYGGGGHRNAAGFKVSKKHLLTIL